MNDLINRQDAIDGFYNVKVHGKYCTEYDTGYNDGIDYAISKLSVMPSAQRWIPCSEHLPRKGEEILMSFKDERKPFVVSFTYDIYMEEWTHEVFLTQDGESIPFWVAWMPLPEPYKEEGDTECD